LAEKIDFLKIIAKIAYVNCCILGQKRAKFLAKTNHSFSSFETEVSKHSVCKSGQAQM
jgi:hypothetical protein